MLKFEKTKDHTSCCVEGTLDEIITELTFSIGLVHQAVAEKNKDAADELRKSVEKALEHGSRLNQSIFEHFGDCDWLEKEAEDVKKESAKKLKDDMRRFLEKMLEGFPDDEG